MNTRVTPPPAEARAATHAPTIAMRRELYMSMYEVAREHRDEATKVDGKDQAEEIKHSMIRILFCYTCLEAFINTVGKDKLGRIWDEKWGRNKKSSPDDKWLGLSQLLSSRKH